MAEFRSQAKNQMLDMLRKTKLGERYTFVHKGTPNDAEKFVQKMRVELSRLKNKVKAGGKKVQPFKVRLISVRAVPENIPSTEVILEKAEDAAASGVNMFLGLDLVTEEGV